MPLPDIRFSQRRQQAAEQSIAYLMKQGIENRDVISLAAGFVDEVTLPVSLVRESIADILTDDAAGHQVLQYGTTAGFGPLRENLLGHLARLENGSLSELNVTENEIVVTSGSQQLLQHLSDALFDPGDICLVAAPTYFVFLGTLNGVGARAIAIDTDENGMRMDALETELGRIEAAGELNRVKMIYLVSSFENPSGVTLADDRRKQAVDIAKRWSKEQRILILEDAAYRELRYEGDDRPSIWSYDESRQHVILAQTFSKSFSPGIRVAYGVLPRDLVSAVHDVKGNFDFGSPNLNQRIISHALQSGKYEAHVAGLQSSYRVKRDAMLAAADEFFTDIPGVSWLRPHGGLYVWMTLPDEIETGFDSPLFQQASKGEGVMYVPGEIAYPKGSPLQKRTQMRLSFGVESPETIRDGMQRLSRAVRHVMD
ncbi:MAG: 2-aminoadipate transaminase [Planctomycetaceae bacterium]|jgi:2-aminoadipate transaminase